ncbi:MAG: Rne/Rng family ribonuclease [Chitinophagales bacterium]|nr:Rne/Rng family ribonuclease [Chitinophagales bacterium]MDW8393019.1 Rne/Rng family ribonuclease [Chitinophagales bacterium]
MPTDATPKRELIINAGKQGVELALLEDGLLVELHQDHPNRSLAIGDLILARIDRIVAGMNAAFVDIGQAKNGFLHYSDLGPQIRSLQKFTRMALEGSAPDNLADFELEPETLKTGKIANTLNKRTPLLVQIIKEPISTKGHRLSCDISLAGRFLVLIPFTNEISISKKIAAADERKRLQRLVESIRPKNFGIIVRTLAEGRSVQELHEELMHLMEKWKSLTRQLKGAQPPAKVLSELNKTSTLLRDMLNDSFHRIVVNSRDLYNEIRNYIGRISPEQVDIVQLYSGRTPVFDQFDVTKQIKSSFGRQVPLKNGGHLIIEHTEAMHVIDVNSGQQQMQAASQEENALAINLAAIQEVARQLRLRDLGGIIIVDLIDVRNPESRRQLQKTMHELMKRDKARHTILPISRFGLMQITRQRVKPEVSIATEEVCPDCGGTGKIGPSILILDEIEKNLEHIIRHNNQKQITLFVHPYLEAYITKGLWSIRMKWWWKYRRFIRVDSNDNLAIGEFHFYDSQGEEIVLNGGPQHQEHHNR